MPTITGIGLEGLKKIIESLGRSSEVLKSVDRTLLLKVAKRLSSEIASRGQRSKL